MQGLVVGHSPMGSLDDGVDDDTDQTQDAAKQGTGWGDQSLCQLPSPQTHEDGYGG